AQTRETCERHRQTGKPARFLPAGMDVMRQAIQNADRLMEEAAASGVFPGAALAVFRRRQLLFSAAYGRANVFSNRPVTLDTVFDLASLTKPLATSLAVMDLAARGQMGLEQSVAEIFPEFRCPGKERVQIRHLLAHISGFPAYRPYYLELARIPAAQRREALLQRLLEEPLVYWPGEQTLYSDLGFMLLCLAVEKSSGLRLDRYVEDNIYQPAGIRDLFFIDQQEARPRKDFAATEYCSWRSRVLEGEVHDENAFSMGGICGHAGLFGTVRAVSGLLMHLLDAYCGRKPGTPQALVQRFLRRHPCSERALGFDMPSMAGSSAGLYFDRDATVGHLGFTGTSFWMALDRAVFIVLLSNRIHPDRDNERIHAFRPRLHDCIMAALR
ncbi:MAG TPA: serine hydrolase domain-containing protein, partial [Desulfosalsimonadaceae bacterium]|nr:serine hydrolase domain-containing protein [Desulfosalsimonadaceae bacterium]